MKANIARIDKGKQSDVNAEVSKPMSKTPPRLNKNSELLKVIKSYKNYVPILGELLKVLSFLTQFLGNSNSSMSYSSHIRTRAFSSS